tara:strand:+ start:11670 stop:11963 length:294 start_codon:yes stop_codon:yes gene_type:complete
MLDLRKYTSPIHTVKFEEGEVYLKKMSASDVDDCEEMDGAERCLETLRRSLCDKNGKICNYTTDELKAMDNDLITSLYIESLDFNKPKKKLDLKPKK